MARNVRVRPPDQRAARAQKASPKTGKTPSLADVPKLPPAFSAIGAFYGQVIPSSLRAMRWDTRARAVLALFAALWLAFVVAGVSAVATHGFGQGVGFGVLELLLCLVLSVFVGLIPFGYIFRGVMAVERREYDRFAITNRNRNLPVRVSLWFQKVARQQLAKQGLPNARVAMRSPVRR